MVKKLYTGGYLLSLENNNTQFGSIDATFNVVNKTDFVRIKLRQEDLEKFHLEDGFISIGMNLEQLEALIKNANAVYENLRVLKLLDKRKKLMDHAYLIED